MTEITDRKDIGGWENLGLTAHGLKPAGVTLFLADWTEALFIRFAVPVQTLRPHVPAELEIDTFNGTAYVSLVAFTQRNLRPAFGGRIGRLIAMPLAEHAFLNLRTYVRYRGEPGIHFIAEWIPNRLATLIGPRTYGLPYRLARMKYRCDARTGNFSGSVVAESGAFRFEAAPSLTLPRSTEGGDQKESAPINGWPHTPSLGTPGEGRGGGPRAMEATPAELSTLDDFLLERYTAWTERAGVIRRFRIAHVPWEHKRADVRITDRALIDTAAPWMREIEPAHANYSPGAFNVEIGRPVREHADTALPRNPRRPLSAFLPLIVLPLAAFLTRNLLPAWAFMWLLAMAIFAGCKYLTLVDAKRAGLAPSFGRTVGYLFAWVGMDANRWFARDRSVIAPERTEVARAAINVCAGILLTLIVARLAPSLYLAGCIGSIGAVLVLHFGFFHLLALAWQWAGVDAEPLMNRPAVAKSVAEFWGKRWNRGFNTLAERYLFRPTMRRFGPRAATLATFLASGVVHDLVISLPARGGYGLPTLYFLIHGAAVLSERSVLKVPFRARPLLARVYTIGVIALPGPLLLHPPFVYRVIVPMLRAVGAV